MHHPTRRCFLTKPSSHMQRYRTAFIYLRINLITSITTKLKVSRRAIDAQQTLSDKTNELLLKNAEALHLSATETAKAAERPIVDIDTLQRCNKKLIASIKDVVRIHEQGTIQREKAQEAMAKIEAELKQAMLEAAVR